MGLPTTPRCGDRGRTAGSVPEVIASLAESVHQVCGSACSSAGQLMFSLATESSPPTAPHTGATQEAAPQRALHQPPQRKIREAPSLFPGEK